MMKVSDGIVNIFRGTARPIISIIAMAVLAQVITQGVDISAGEWALLSGIVLWWFGDRTISKVRNVQEKD